MPLLLLSFLTIYVRHFLRVPVSILLELTSQTQRLSTWANTQTLKNRWTIAGPTPQLYHPTPGQDQECSNGWRQNSPENHSQVHYDNQQMADQYWQWCLSHSPEQRWALYVLCLHLIKYYNEVFSAGNLARAGVIMGGITKGCIDPTKHTDQKSLEATIKSAGLTTAFVDDCFESLNILKKKWTAWQTSSPQYNVWKYALLIDQIHCFEIKNTSLPK